MTKMTLKTLRATKNLSQKQAAKKLGVSVDTWGNRERGDTEPSVSKAYQIADEFGVSIDDIIFLPQIAV
ncbi:helix-turn-helix transcriptional regulator [Streptococcus pluranimalium]|uniref:helix-turn-helix transcriptional regulator n=1 Tax=Streptococcus pluranimalium TaxID=82348 RepID=UPI003BF8B33C